MMPKADEKAPREITGRVVLGCLVGFFAVVFAANAVLVKLAASSFSGLETGGAYQAGLAFNKELAAARAQKALNWQIETRLLRPSENHLAQLTVTVRDAAGRPPSDLAVTARLKHPADARRDAELVLHRQGAGVFTGEVDLTPGQWDVVVDVWRGDARLYRAQTRTFLR